MILFVGDVHGDLAVINRHVRHARDCGANVSQVVQFGDLGASRMVLNKYFVLAGQRFEAPVSFIDGNHEDFFFLSSLNRLYGEHLTHLERGSVHEIGGYRALCLGGAAYMDPVNTPPAAVIRNADIERCLAHDPSAADVIFSHDSPREACVPGCVELNYCGITGFPRGGELLAHFRPALWVFAHHHRYFDCSVQGTRFLGLDLAARGYVLLGPDYTVTRVEHEAAAIPDREAIYTDRPGGPQPLEGKAGVRVARSLTRSMARLMPKRRDTKE